MREENTYISRYSCHKSNSARLGRSICSLVSSSSLDEYQSHSFSSLIPNSKAVLHAGSEQNSKSPKAMGCVTSGSYDDEKASICPTPLWWLTCSHSYNLVYIPITEDCTEYADSGL